jgi:hypothetical protein
LGYQLNNRIKNRVAPPVTAPNVAPFLPPMAAPIAVAMPAVAATRRASLSQDRRFPPPHNTIAEFIYAPLEEFSCSTCTPRSAHKKARRLLGALFAQLVRLESETKLSLENTTKNPQFHP